MLVKVSRKYHQLFRAGIATETFTISVTTVKNHGRARALEHGPDVYIASIK